MLSKHRLRLLAALCSLLPCVPGYGDPPASATYEYDDAGRLKQATYSNGAAVQYQLDPAGNRQQVVLTQATPRVELTSATHGVTEGTATVTITARRLGGTVGAVSVSYATSNGAATAPGDFTAASGSFSWGNGVTTDQTVAIAIADDAAYETSEQFTFTISSPTGGAVLGSIQQATVTITDNDTAPSFAIADASLAEGGGSLIFTVTKSGATALSHALNYVTANATATAGSDYTAASGTLTFAAADLTKTFSVPITEDALYEGATNETFTASISAPTNGATISDSSGTSTILENDAPPSFSINDVSLAENGGSLIFTVTKSGGTVFTHAVNYVTANGTAVAGSDFTAASGTLTFLAADLTMTFSVPITNDTAYEGNEAFTSTLNTPTNGATISDSSGTGTINENDAAPTFGINVVAQSTEGQTVSFNVYKTGSTALVHQVSYATANGTASAGSDYTAVSGTFTFQPADTNNFIVVNTTDDSTNEPTESFSASISNPTNGAVISGPTSISTDIIDNDGVPSTPQNLTTSPVNESYGGEFTLLWNASTGPVSYYQVEENGSTPYFQSNHPSNWYGFSRPSISGTTYEYRVRACTAGGQCSTWSNQTAITTCPEWGCP